MIVLFDLVATYLRGLTRVSQYPKHFFSKYHKKYFFASGLKEVFGF